MKRIEIHPDYSCKKLENDIALMKLNVDLSWIDADPACFPVIGQTSFISLGNVQATIVGWGATNEDYSLGKDHQA